MAPNQRAALLLRDVLGFRARETAEILGTSVASVNSALQRARAKLERELPARSQQETLRALGDERSRDLVARFVDAWNRADVAAIRRVRERRGRHRRSSVARSRRYAPSSRHERPWRFLLA